MPQDVRDLILAILGNAVFISAIAYWIKSRADIQVKQAQGSLEKTQSDEAQELKRQESFDRMLEYLGESLREMRESEKRHQRDYEEMEKRREDDYLATKELYIQTGAEFRQAILDIRREMHDLLAELRKGFQQDLTAGFTDAIERNQTQSAIRDVFTTFSLGFRFPDESDPRWKWCIIRFSHTEQMNVYKVPKFIDDNFVTTIKSGEQVWIISDRYSGLDDWGFIRPYNDPHLHGYIQMHGLSFLDCQILKKVDKTPPEGLPPITAVVPAPG